MAARNTRQTSAKAAWAASKVLINPKASKAAKSAAASALSQTQKRKRFPAVLPSGRAATPAASTGAAPLDLKEARVKRTVDNSFTKLDENLNLDPFVRQPALSMTGRRR
jgi:hypothetical protein